MTPTPAPRGPESGPPPRGAARRSTFTVRDVGLLLLLAFFWGNSFLFIKIAVPELPPAWIVSTRMVIGGAIICGIVAARRAALPRDRSLLMWLAIIGIVGTGLPWVAQAWAQQSLDSGLVAVLNATTSVSTLLLAVAFGVERLYGLRVAGLVIAIVGSLIVIGGEVNAGGPIPALIVATLAPFGYGLGSVLTRQRVTGRSRPLPAVAVQLVAGAAFIAPLAVAMSGPPPDPLGLSLPAALSLTALGVFGTGLAFLIYFTLIERVGATNASMVTYVVPIVGLVSGALVRGETFGVNVFVGALVLIVGVYVAQLKPREQS